MSNSLAEKPADFPSPAEYGNPIVKQHWHGVETLAKATAAVRGYPTATLQFWTAGYKEAGSMAIWCNACWAVRYDFDGGIHGRRFNPEDEDAARAYFAQLTDPAKVSARRAEDERLERDVYGPARERRARELAADKAAKAARAKAMRDNRKRRAA